MNGIFDPKRKAKVPSSEVSELRKQLKELVKSANKTEVDNAKLANLTERIAKLNDMLERQYREVKKKKPNKEVQSELYQELQQEKFELEKLIKTKDEVTELNRRLKEGDYEGFVSPRQERVVKSQELIDAEIEKHRLKREINRRIRELKPRTKAEIAWEIYDIPRTSKLTMDVGHLYRQGGFFIANPKKVNPFEFIGITFDALKSQEGADAIELRIRNSEFYDDAKVSGLHFIEEGQALNERERVISNNILERIPYIGKVITASARTQATSMNWLRMRLYEGYASRHPDMTAGQAKEVSEAINRLSGYGTGRFVSTVAPYADKVLTSTRFTASRVQSLGVIPKYWDNKALRNELIEDTMWFWGWRVALMGIAYLASDDEWYFGENPDNHTYGKLIVPVGGDQVRIYDPWAGFQQAVYRGSKLTDSADKPLEVAGDFLSSKASPSVQALWTIAWGKKYPNQDIPRWEAALRAFSPISLEGVVDSLAEDTGMFDLAFSSTMDAIGINSYTMAEEDLERDDTEFAKFIDKRAKRKEKREEALEDN
jgi:hypothetical protein